MRSQVLECPAGSCDSQQSGVRLSSEDGARRHRGDQGVPRCERRGRVSERRGGGHHRSFGHSSKHRCYLAEVGQCAEVEQSAVVSQGRRICGGLRCELSAADWFPIGSDRCQLATTQASAEATSNRRCLHHGHPGAERAVGTRYVNRFAFTTGLWASSSRHIGGQYTREVGSRQQLG